MPDITFPLVAQIVVFRYDLDLSFKTPSFSEPNVNQQVYNQSLLSWSQVIKSSLPIVTVIIGTTNYIKYTPRFSCPYGTLYSSFIDMSSNQIADQRGTDDLREQTLGQANSAGRKRFIVNIFFHEAAY